MNKIKQTFNEWLFSLSLDQINKLEYKFYTSKIRVLKRQLKRLRKRKKELIYEAKYNNSYSK